MHRLWWVALAGIAAAAAPVAADPTELGGWFGPRLFSASSRLGYVEDAQAQAALQNTMQLGARVARPFLPWLVPELELVIAPATTTPVNGARSVSVFWFEPRIHLRFDLRPGTRIQPFVMIGGGSPVAVSASSRTYGTSIIGEGYVGGGVRFDTGKGFELRADARLAILPSRPGAGFAATAELEVGLGIALRLGATRARPADAARPTAALPDGDGDGVPDDQDACPDRGEDKDGFEDGDGCPDIDNDLDAVLDFVDSCPAVPEAYNGFEDDDGCPDTLPADVDALRGTIAGLSYGDGETVVRDAGLATIRKIAATMTAHPSIRVVLIGHTDDREARQFTTGDPGQPALDLEAMSADLSRARAEAVRNELVTAGIPARRIIVDGRGAADPVADNARPRGRLANRRVEIKLYVPPR
jgi:outer membrane protein OmpA-like peptidoglycan-associated protein